MLPFEKQEVKKKTGWLWTLYLAAVFFIAADLLAGSYLLFVEFHKNRVYPGVSLGNIELGGKTAEQAKQALTGRINDLNESGVTFAYEDHVATVTPIISSFSGDLAYTVISFDIDATINSALAVGRNHNFFQNGLEQFRSWLGGERIKTAFSTDDGKLKDILSENFGQLAQPARDAQLYATTTPNYWKKKIIFKIREESPGATLDYDGALDKLKANLENLDNSPITIAAIKGTPAIRKNECVNIETKAGEFLDQAELTLTYENKKWPIAKEQIATWLKLARGLDGQVTFDLDADKIQAYLGAKIAPQIEIAPVNARFQIKDNRVVEFATSSDGLRINFAQTFQSLRSDFLGAGQNSVAIAVMAVPSDTATKNTNDLGIAEIIGTGHSNFAGSPKNRIHNIQTGAASLNGLMVAPGEEFSTDKALGLVDASTGYLPEMTIKGDKTVPEFGGGLCQIGTTMFRAALATGFPITARQPHSYRVVYYEPAGTDATIYQPWPDLRFINDSKNFILIQSHISGNDIYFDFWGTKDGRVVEETDPTISNIVRPGPTKLIETLDLPPGQKKCTERAHNGADAYFDYKVTYPDGTVKQKRFSSHYVPWREVCLIGVAKLSTSTPAIIPPK